MKSWLCPRLRAVQQRAMVLQGNASWEFAPPLLSPSLHGVKSRPRNPATLLSPKYKPDLLWLSGTGCPSIASLTTHMTHGLSERNWTPPVYNITQLDVTVTFLSFGSIRHRSRRKWNTTLLTYHRRELRLCIDAVKRAERKSMLDLDPTVTAGNKEFFTQSSSPDSHTTMSFICKP